MEKFVLTPKEAGEYISLGENAIRNLCNRGEIKATRCGNLWKIPRPCLEDFVLQKAREGKPIEF